MNRVVREYNYSSFVTPFGTGIVVVKGAVVVAVRLPESASGLPHSNGLELSRGSSSSLSERAAQMVQGYFAGENVLFDLPLSFEGKTDFQRAVLDVVRSIPYGSVMTYGEVALKAGSPRGARGVGRVMASNELPIIIPCHRVVGVSGAMIGYTAPGGLAMKRWLLELEGIGIGLRGRVKR